MKKNEIKKLLKEQMLCRIAFKGDGFPYMAPFQYTQVNGHIYFHFTNYGKKMKLLEKDARVCVEMESHTKKLSEYRFVVLRGSLKVVTDPKERAIVLRRMSKEGQCRLSKNFLSAHGINKNEGWSALNPERAFVIVKLENLVEEIGLKSQ